MWLAALALATVEPHITLAGAMNHYKKRRALWHVAAAITLLVCSVLAVAAENKWTPRHEGRVTDLANVLSVSDRDRLTKMLARYEQETSHQIAVLLVPTVSDESIESFSLRVANVWRIGLRGLDNGILVAMAMKERKVRIEVGLGMERYITNATAQSIIGQVSAFVGQPSLGVRRTVLVR